MEKKTKMHTTWYVVLSSNSSNVSFNVYVDHNIEEEEDFERIWQSDAVIVTCIARAYTPKYCSVNVFRKYRRHADSKRMPIQEFAQTLKNLYK